jgi:2-(1,2-epoxy-1,2-dihydrophenyl)acetyl-CoA isomerase
MPERSSRIRSRVEDGVLTITLDHPAKKNALRTADWVEFSDVLRRSAADRTIRVAVLEGSGGDFCSGADLTEDRPGHPLPRIELIHRTVQDLYGFPAPVIGKVKGVAAGAGVSLALCCDLVVAAEDARFLLPFVHRGLSVDTGTSWLLPRLIGLQQAKRLAYLGETILAGEAVALGLALRSEPVDEIDRRVAEMARRLVRLPRVALSQDKALLNASLTQSLPDALQSEARAQSVNFATSDAAEGRRAFLEKRDPTFSGDWLVS